MLTELALLREVLLRRDPELAHAAEALDVTPLDGATRERVRRAVIDELCELPDAEGGRRALRLSELLVHLAEEHPA